MKTYCLNFRPIRSFLYEQQKLNFQFYYNVPLVELMKSLRFNNINNINVFIIFLSKISLIFFVQFSHSTLYLQNNYI
jgi:hypothetical protein